MARPTNEDIAKIKPNTKRLTSPGAVWTPIACAVHEGDEDNQGQGFAADCPACVDTAANTIEHMRQTGVTFP